MKEKKHTVLRVIMAFTLAGLYLLVPMASAQEPPSEQEKECLAYAYTESENHNFLVSSNSSNFGTLLRVVHNCDDVELFIDGNMTVSSSVSFSYPLDPGLHNISLISDDFSIQFDYVMFYPDRLNWEGDYLIIQEQKPQFIDRAISEERTNYAVGFGIFIVWILTTYVYWSLINSYVQRNFIEEVVQ